jgi:CRP/FNR family transcriptional regulator, dissimilatory nitrate respiration regulator
MKNLIELRKLSLFENMPKDEVESLVNTVPFTTKEIPRGGTILFQGNHYTDLFILARGSAYAERIDVSGKTMTIHTLHAPEVLAPGVLFSRNDDLPGSVIAETDATFYIVSRQNVGVLCTQSTQFRDNFLRLISDRFVFISRRMTFLSFTTIKGKVAQYLLTLDGSDMGTVVLPVTMEELAGYFGVTRPSVSRVFIELERNGLIRKDKKRVEILDGHGIKALLM